MSANVLFNVVSSAKCIIQLLWHVLDYSIQQLFLFAGKVIKSWLAWAMKERKVLAKSCQQFSIYEYRHTHTCTLLMSELYYNNIILRIQVRVQVNYHNISLNCSCTAALAWEEWNKTCPQIVPTLWACIKIGWVWLNTQQFNHLSS